ncbi:MAG TPA: hypothetical protein VLB68_03655 [Pyrinomonadaceae bacterium]|nr:hypothetical protein [Pyrinomonadaceae bacterium]
MNEQPTPLPSDAEEDQNIFLAVVLGMGAAVVFGLGGFFLLQDGALITRTTTITSRLSPAWYWQRLEKIGVETEHQYLFEELSKRLNGAR